jgi:hypothetical protein
MPSPSAPADVLQAYFNMILAMSQQAIGQVKETGYTPQMVWDADAYNGVGGFVPTGNAVETMALVQNRYQQNRATMSALAVNSAQYGMVPQVQVDENGYLFQAHDPITGQPMWNETDASRSRRQSAGQAVGYVSRDLMNAPVNVTGHKVGPAPGENMMRDQAPTGLAQQPAPQAPAGPEAAAPPPPPPTQEGGPGDMVIGNGQFIDTTGMQFPSGRNPQTGLPQGSAYTPQDMGTDENQRWLAEHPFQAPTPGSAPVAEPLYVEGVSPEEQQ